MKKYKQKKYKQKKYRQKMLAVIMILTLAALALTGCGQEAGSGGSSEGSGSGEIGGSGGENRQSIRAGMEVPEELTDVNRQIGDTSFEIFRQAAAGPAGSGKSAMISPMSLLVCLSMAQAGAEGNTKAEMEQAFGWTSGEFASWLDCWYGSLTDEDETRMNVANSFWYRQGFRPENDYLKMLKDSFHGTARESAFDDGTVSDINRWCDENTYGMIPHFIDHLEPDQSALLLNAVVFEGKWLKAYDDAQVSEKENFVTENGKKRQAVMLYSQEDRYLSGSHVTGFLKPYQDGYSFAAFLPEEGVTVSQWLKETDGKEFLQILQNAKSASVNAVIPQFKSEYTAENMKAVLQDMGIHSLFSAIDCDLSAMGENESGEGLYVGDVLHKTFIELNREGTRAAAVTGLIMENTSLSEPKEVYEVRLDRPFVYAIIDDASMTPVFMGIVMDVK